MAFLAGQGIGQVQQSGILQAAAPPPAFTFSPFAQFPDKVHRGLKIAVIAATGVIAAPFIPQTPSLAYAKQFEQPLKHKRVSLDQPTQSPFIQQQFYLFSGFDQPRRLKTPQIADTSPWLEQEAPETNPLGFYALFDQPKKTRVQQIADTAPWLEQEPPETIIWGYITQFDQPKWGSKVPYQAAFDFKALELPIPGADPFVKWPDWRKKKKKKPSWEIQDEEKAERRRAIELAIYGPPVEYNFNPVNWEIPKPPNTDELARVILQAIDQATQEQAEREAEEEERIIEMMLKDEQ